MNPAVTSYMQRQKQWQRESELLREILLTFPMEEELKWGKPCYTVGGKNIVLIGGFKEYCVLLFFKGALMADPKCLLIPPGNSQAARQLRFTSPEDVAAKKALVKAYVTEALAVEKSGKKVALKKHSEYELPAELQKKLDSTPNFRKAFEALTPGRQRGYMLFIAGAKQAATREARVEKSVHPILEGKGIND